MGTVIEPVVEPSANVNVPDVPFDELKGLKLTRRGRRCYPDDIIEREDPRGGKYYWIGGAEPGHVAEPGTDFDGPLAFISEEERSQLLRHTQPFEQLACPPRVLCEHDIRGGERVL